MKEPLIIYKSQVMADIMTLVKRVAKSESTVLILGESGAGKELIAEAVHYYSNRRNEKFVAVNCASLNENILESELFGHVKGSYTDAKTTRIGKFEYAQKGTIFLDEIGDMLLSTQAKILRVMQNKTFERLGDNHSINVNTRIITATNSVLSEKIENNQFRKDLYYRLAVIIINIPPLRERREDICPLAEFYIEKYAKKFNKHISTLTQKSRDKLKSYDWPGNARELENVIERTVLFVDDLEINSYTIIIDHQTINRDDSLYQAERNLIVNALTKAKGRQDIAANLLGISSRVINYKIHQKYRIMPTEYNIQYKKGGHFKH